MFDTDRKPPRVRERSRPSRPEPEEMVGYCHPPKSGQFKKGRSGNPKGRPRKDMRDRSFEQIFYDTAHKRIPVNIQNGKAMMIIKEALALKVLQHAMNGSMPAVRTSIEIIGRLDKTEVAKNDYNAKQLEMVKNMIVEMLTGNPDDYEE
jgi:hypothetical protein